MTHDELVMRARKWLVNRGCGVVLTELVTSSPETPDAIGWMAGGRWSYLIECKTSRSDFYADSKKQGRSELRSAGLGRERYYMAEPGVLDVASIKRNRPGWGLIEIHGKRSIVVLRAIPHNHESLIKEIPLLYSCVWRIQHNTGVDAVKGSP
jgi:hypothetical protein